VLGGVGIAMSVFAAITASFTPEWPLVVVMTVTALYGFTAVSWNGVFVGQLAQQAPREHVSEVAGAGAFCAFAGVAAGPAVFSAVLGATGSYAAGFAVFAALTCAIGVWLLASRDDVES
jgi:predicted MFS family arabinose efflux permease